MIKMLVKVTLQAIDCLEEPDHGQLDALMGNCSCEGHTFKFFFLGPLCQVKKRGQVAACYLLHNCRVD